MKTLNSENAEPVDDFDAEKSVVDYRRVMAKLERARKPETKRRYGQAPIASRLRNAANAAKSPVS